MTPGPPGPPDEARTPGGDRTSGEGWTPGGSGPPADGGTPADGRPGDGGPALVPGELRGFRQFHLLPDGLYPLVHQAAGAWSGGVEHAVCAAGQGHAAPAADCRCGLYAWYLPGAATVGLGAWNAVIAARGRCVLGDRGFRAASARIEAVALPATVRWWPFAAARVRRQLAERYPAARVYPSTRRMLAAHPPQDVSALGLQPPRDVSRGYRTVLALLFVGFVISGYSLVLLPQGAVSSAAVRWWPLGVVLVLAWQAAMVWLVSRLMSAQSPHVERPPGDGEPPGANGRPAA